MSFPGLPDRNKRLANNSPETMSMSRLHDRDKRPVIASSSRAGWESFTSPITTSAALRSHVNRSHPPVTTSRLQAGQEDISNPLSTISDSEPTRAPQTPNRPLQGLKRVLRTTLPLRRNSRQALQTLSQKSGYSSKYNVPLDRQRNAGPSHSRKWTSSPVNVFGNGSRSSSC
jgi:hypothetical protein